MKLKNSYILLIAMIVLLISIGSVCASENVGTDKEILTGDQTDIVLTDGEDATQEKINTTVNVGETSYKFQDNETQKITVDVLDNESKSIGYNQGSLIISTGNKTVSYTINNTELTLTNKLAVGNHTLLITFIGNDTYKGSVSTVNVSVFHAKTLEMPSLIVSEDGSKATIPVVISDGLTNYSVNNTNLKINLTYIDETGSLKSSILTYTYTGNNVSISLPNFIQANVTVTLTETSSSKKANIKIASSVDADDVEKRDTEDKNITVTVKGGDGKTLTIKKSDLKILEGTKELAFNYNNGIITITTKLTTGKHNLTIKYAGNNTYAETNKSVILGIYGNSTFDTVTSTNVDDNNEVNLQVNLTDGLNPITINKNNLTITLNYVDADGEAQSRLISSLTINQDTQIVTFTVSEKFLKANLTVNYTTAEGKKFTKTVTVKINTVINAENITKGNTEVLNITANVTSDDGYELNVTSGNFKIYNKGKALNTTYNNGVLTINDKLTYGTYNLTIKFTGNNTYSDAEKNITLKIIGFKTNTTSVNVNSTKIVEIKLNVTDGTTTYDVDVSDLNITGSYKGSDNNTVNLTFKNIKITNSSLTFEIENANFTSATLIVKYKNSTQANFTLNRIYNIRLVVINNEAEYQSGNFTYKLIDIDDEDEPLVNRTVSLTYSIKVQTITIQNTLNARTNNESIVTFNNSQIISNFFGVATLGIGNNTITIGGSGLKITNSSQTVHISKANITIVVDEYNHEYGSDEKVQIHVFNTKTHDPVKYTTIHLYMADSSAKDYYFSTNENGTSQVSVNGLVGGTYAITVSNNDTENMTATSTSANIVISKIPVVINAKDATIYYNSGTTATIKVTQNGSPVEGVYVLVRLYSTSTAYTDYLFLTNNKGEFSFSASLAVGKHKMIVVLADNRYEASQVTKTITVKKATAKLTAAKTTAYYKQGKYFVVKLTNSKNKKAIYGAKVKITITTKTLRYKPITATTGQDGKVRLTITLNPGTYTVKVAGADSKNFKASTITSKIVVKKAPTKLTPKKLTAKKGSNSYFQIKVTNKKTKKIISGVKLKVKVKSKTYSIKSNSNGIAKLSTKSLKAGTYSVTVTSANKYCVAKTTKSTIKIKK